MLIHPLQPLITGRPDILGRPIPAYIIDILNIYNMYPPYDRYVDGLYLYILDAQQTIPNIIEYVFSSNVNNIVRYSNLATSLEEYKKRKEIYISFLEEQWYIRYGWHIRNIFLSRINKQQQNNILYRIQQCS